MDQSQVGTARLLDDLGRLQLQDRMNAETEFLESLGHWRHPRERHGANLGQVDERREQYEIRSYLWLQG